jgi:membrane dipeptidase
VFSLLAAVAAGVLLAQPAVGQPAPAQPGDAREAQVLRILRGTPLIDGHNDLPWAIREKFASKPEQVNLRVDLRAGAEGLHTDIPRLRQGGVGAQFWSVYIPANLDDARGPEATLQQIDITRQIIATHPDVFEFATTAADIVRIHRAGKIASLIGMEGGHSIHNSLKLLRQMHAAGARYMTLTHSATLDWADSATDAPRHGGLSRFGEEVVREMNRLGMLVDLSHVSAETMADAMRVSEAPVIFSHSSARGVTDHARNVPDEILRQMPADGGVVMVTFVPGFVSERVRAWNAQSAAEEARLRSLHAGDPAGAKRRHEAWVAANPTPVATISDVADHLDHVRRVAGINHVGIGGDYDGVSTLPRGLEGVHTYPALLAELMRRGWSEADIRKLAGENVLRAMRQAEETAARLQRQRGPSNATLAELDSPPATR